MELEKNKPGKNKINPSSELIFNYISGIPFEQARKNFLAAALLQKSLEVEILANHPQYNVYNFQFWHKSATSSGYQLRLASWAQGEMSHVQFFRQSAELNQNRHIHNFWLFGSRLLIGAVLYGMIYYSLFVHPLLALLFIFLALRYSYTFVNDFKFRRQNPFLPEDEALIIQMIESELGDRAELESPEVLPLEDYLEQKAK